MNWESVLGLVLSIISAAVSAAIDSQIQRLRNAALEKGDTCGYKVDELPFEVTLERESARERQSRYIR